MQDIRFGRTVALILCVLLWGCRDSDSAFGVCDNSCEAGKLAASLYSSHTPVNGALLLSLIDNEMGSEPFYMAEYWRLNQDNVEADSLLAQYSNVLVDQLELVGAHIAFDNVVFNQPTMFEGREWHRVRLISYPSPQAFLDVVQAPSYQEAIRLKHQATLALQSLWVKADIAEQVTDPFPERQEFFMSNLTATRDDAMYPDGNRGLSGDEANRLYTNVVSGSLFPEIGAYPAFVGTVEHLVMGMDDQWQRFNLVYYPSLPDFVRMITDPRFQAAFPNKGAGLSRNSTMMTAPLMDPQLP